MNRKQRKRAARRRPRRRNARSRALASKKRDPKQLMADKVQLFGKLPRACDLCQEPFDKKDKSMALSWSVVVRQETVRLFCPVCVNKVQTLINKGEGYES